MTTDKIRIRWKRGLEIAPALAKFADVAKAYGGTPGRHAEAFADAITTPDFSEITNEPLDLLRLVVASRHAALKLRTPAASADIAPEIRFEDMFKMSILRVTGHGKVDAILELIVYRNGKRPVIVWTGDRATMLRDAALLGDDSGWLPADAQCEEMSVPLCSASSAVRQAITLIDG